MPPPPPSQSSDLRQAGFLAAVAVGLLIAAGFAVYFVTRTPPKIVPLPKATSKTPEPTPPKATDDLAQIGMAAGRAQVQFIDRKDPSRTSGMMKWKRLDPEGPGLSKMTEPEGFVFLRDGGLLAVSSKTGRLRTPPRQSEPESGEFEGDVTLRLYDEVPGRAPDPSRDKPSLVATTASLSFKVSEGEINTNDAFTVRSEGVEIDGHGMRVLVNEVEESIQYFSVARVSKMVLRPDKLNKKTTTSMSQAVASNDTMKKTKVPPRKRVFRVLVSDTVWAAQGDRSIEADRIEAWATMIDNALPPGAIGKLGPTKKATTATPPASGAAVPPVPSVGIDDAEPIIASWKGSLEIKPVEEMPKDFASEMVAMRLLAGANGPVSVKDPATSAEATAAQVEYAATTRKLQLRGSAPEPVHLFTAASGDLSCRSAMLDLGAGTADLRGPGVIEPSAKAIARRQDPNAEPESPAADEKKPEALKLSFADRLRLAFGQKDGWISPVLRAAAITGGVEVARGAIKAKGDDAEVVFGSPPAETPDAKPPVAALAIKGHAEASAPAKGDDGKPSETLRDVIAGDLMRVTLGIDAKGGEVPTGLIVDGNASATSRGITIKSRSMSATIEPDAGGQPAITKAVASGEARVDDHKGLTAKADRIEANPSGADTGVATLFGESRPVEIYRDGTTMTGPKVRLTAATGELFVDGAGVIKSLRETDQQTPQYFETAWSKHMTFVNTTGVAECVGDSVTVMTTGDEERNTVKGERVVLTFPPSSNATANQNRELLTAEAKGTNGSPATLEHRRYTLVNGEKKTERLVYLQGPSILANQPQRSLSVPGAGKLLVDDRRAGAPESSAAGPIGTLTNARGTSLFTWDQALSMSLARNQIGIRGNVSLVHQPAERGGVKAQPVNLECQDLQAWLQQTAPNASSLDAMQATLQRVEARDGVHVASEGKELWASKLEFDAAAAMITATGTESELVTLQDPTKQAPLRARQIIWNQGGGEVRLVDPAPTIIGR